MRQTISSVLVGLFTFLLGVALTIVWLRLSQQPSKEINAQSVQQPASSEQPILAFCELANNPDKYSGKLVRVSGTLSGFIHGMVLFDPNCSSIGTQTAVFYNVKNRDEIEKCLEKVRGSDDWRIPVNIITEGEFRRVTPSNQSDTVYDTAPLQFEIKRIEKASKMR
jgi:hypothetical protein